MRATRTLLQVAVRASTEVGTTRPTRTLLQGAVRAAAEAGMVRATRTLLQVAVPPDPYLINDRITATQRAHIQAVRAGHYMLVEVQDVLSVWQNLAAIGGLDYVLNASITQQLETPATSATITVRAGLGNTSIAPLMATATANASGTLLDLARRVRVRLAILPLPTAPAPADYVTVFTGTIDRIDANDGQTITLNCRDLLVPVLDATFDRTVSYGNGSTPVETILQAMLTEALGAAAPTLITVVSPSWAPPAAPFAVVAKRGDSLWAKMAELTDQIGWLVRYRWNGPDLSELRFFAPDRTAAAARYTIIPFEVATVQGAALDLAGLRNTVQIIYTISGVQSYYTAISGSSVALYGTRKLIIKEAATSQINSAATAKRMADAILADIELPPFTHTFGITHCFWAPEAGDVIDVPANDTTHSATQRLAVAAITLTLDNATPNGNSAVLLMRGKPASRGTSWLAFSGSSADPASGGGAPSSITSLTITNTGTTNVAGNLVATWAGVGLPAGGDYRITIPASGPVFPPTGITTGVTSPRTIGSGRAYSDGVMPPNGKIGPNNVFVTIDMRDAGGNVVATRSQLSALYFYI